MTASAPSAASPLRRWRGPPLAFQILGLLIGGLVVAQLVTLFLTMVLPPAPPVTYGLDDIAAELRGAPGRLHDGGLQRLVQAGPPDLSGPGWLVSERSRHELAALLGVADRDVSLSFYTPLPFAGSALPPPRPRMADDGLVPAFATARLAGDGPARLILAQLQLPPMERPVDALPPRRDAAIGNGPPPRDAFPPNIRPGAPPPGTIERRPPPIRGGGADLLPRGAGSLYRVDPTPAAPGLYIPGDGGAAVPALLSPPAATAAVPGTTSTSAPTAAAAAAALRGRLDPNNTLDPAVGLFPRFRDMARVGSMADQPGFARLVPQSPLSQASPMVQMQPAPPAAPPAAAPRAAAPAEAPLLVMPQPPSAPPLLTPLAPAPAIVEPAPTPTGPPIAVTPPARGLFGFAPAPFVEGDFVAALRLADGRWSVVQPAAEPFPNAWQRRLLLWFAVAFAIVAPLGWLFARRLVKPLAGFADAAERLGRDPAGAVIALDGPAEMGRAARAFNLMQGRLRSFVDDRTAMVGAISHDLRTPLTRLRFRIEDVPDDQREGMLEEVEEMEAMISSVLDFIRDASTPNARERMDLRTLVDDVVEDALLIGSDVTVEQGGSATVEVDVLGMRRVLDNLLENAVKYGARARVRLRTEPNLAVAEIFDDGPGLPDDELERVFEPFYRSEAALNSGAKGSGLGLAVCRSITRAHGGDVRLMQSHEGFVAQVRVPLAA